MPDNNEFYRNEHPGGGFVPLISGLEWRDAPNRDKRPLTGEWHPSEGGEMEVAPPVWSEVNQQFLKVVDGFLVNDGKSSELLSGSWNCRWPPPVIGWISGDNEHIHTDCLLIKTDVEKAFVQLPNPPLSETQWKSGMCIWGYLPRLKPGTINFSGKWQSGHFDHAKILRVRFAVLGVDLSYKALPLQSFVPLFTITVSDDYNIYVNNIRGSFSGNGKFLE